MAIKRCHNSTVGTVVGKDKDFAFYNRIRGCNRNRSLIRRGSIYFDFPTILCNGFDNRIFRRTRNRVGNRIAFASVENGYVRCIECNCKLGFVSFGNRDYRFVGHCKIDIIRILRYAYENAIQPVFTVLSRGFA